VTFTYPRDTNSESIFFYLCSEDTNSGDSASGGALVAKWVCGSTWLHFGAITTLISRRNNTLRWAAQNSRSGGGNTFVFVAIN